MANYVHCPRDLKKIQKKWFWKFTKRQTICFGIGLLLGFITYYLTFHLVGTSVAVFLLILVAAPFVMCGMYKKHGMYLEDVVKNHINFLRSDNTLIYKSTNFYEALIKEAECLRIKKKLKKNGVAIPRPPKKKELKITAQNDKLKL